MVNKKGQITVYIIIGLIALMSLGVFMYLRAEKLPEAIIARPVIEEVPTEMQPLYDFIQDCLYLTAKDGLDKVGVFGGYTSWENVGGTYNPYFPTEGDGVEMFPDSGIVVPYWYYLSSDNDCELQGNCQFATKRPSLYREDGEPSIEGQLDDYVEENIRDCFSNFIYFSQQGYSIEEESSPEVRTIVTEESVAFYLDYPIRITREGTAFTVDEYFVDMPVRLKRVFQLATNITNIQANFHFAEVLLMNLITLNSGLDKDKIPPTRASGMSISGGLFWIKYEVKEKMKLMLAGATPLLRTIGTEDYDTINASTHGQLPERANTFVNWHTIVPTIGEVYAGITSDFIYLPIWEPYFNLVCYGSAGAVCQPSSFSLNLALVQIGLQDYRNYYFFSYPLLVELVDDEAYGGARPYTFNFFLEGNLRKNQPLKPDFHLGVSPAPGGVAPLFCKEAHWDSPDITLRVWDNKDRVWLEGAQVLYSCGQSTCVMGMTNESGSITRSFPRCLGGRIGASKPDYLTVWKELTTDVDFPVEERIDLEQLRRKDIIVKKIVLLKQEGTEEWIAQSGEVALPPKEEAIVMMERLTDDGGESFMTFAEYCTDVSKDCMFRDARIYPGTYDVEIILLTRKEFSIEPDRRCEGEDTLFSDEECFYLPEEAIEFGEAAPFLKGGVQNQIYIGGDQLDGNDAVVVKTLAFGVDKIPDPTIEDMSSPSLLQEYHQAVLASQLLPSFVKVD